LPPRQEEKIVQAVEKRLVAEMYFGPLPRVEDFAAYERVQKGAANRIIKMAEKSLDGEVYAIKTSKRTDYVSMLLSRIFLYALLVSAVVLALMDKPVAATLAGLAPVISVIYSTFKPKDVAPKTTKPKPKQKKVEKNEQKTI